MNNFISSSNTQYPLSQDKILHGDANSVGKAPVGEQSDEFVLLQPSVCRCGNCLCKELSQLEANRQVLDQSGCCIGIEMFFDNEIMIQDRYRSLGEVVMTSSECTQ